MPNNNDFKNGAKSALGSMMYDPWVNGTGLFGQMTNEDMARIDVSMANTNWMQQLALMDYENFYNSPEQQASRMRQAGLNPDLQGVDNTPSASATPNTPQMPAAQSRLEQAGAAVSMIASVGNITASMMQGVSSIATQGIQRLGSEVGLITSLMDAIEKGDTSGFDLDSLPLSNRLKRRYQKVLDGVSSNVRGGWFSRMLGKVKEDDAYQLQQNYNYWSKHFDKRYNSPDIDGDRMITEKDWAQVWKPLADFAQNAFRYELEGNQYAAENRRDQEYTRTTDDNGDVKTIGALRGDTEWSSLVEEGSAKEYMSDIRGPLREVAKNLKKKSDEGNNWATFALIALYFVSNLSIGKSSTSSPMGTTSTTSVGF